MAQPPLGLRLEGARRNTENTENVERRDIPHGPRHRRDRRSVSGLGQVSLAFDTIFAEGGQWSYIEFSVRLRAQVHSSGFDRPDVDASRTSVRHSRSSRRIRWRRRGVGRLRHRHRAPRLHEPAYFAKGSAGSTAPRCGSEGAQRLGRSDVADELIESDGIIPPGACARFCFPLPAAPRPTTRAVPPRSSSGALPGIKGGRGRARSARGPVTWQPLLPALDGLLPLHGFLARPRRDAFARGGAGASPKSLERALIDGDCRGNLEVRGARRQFERQAREFSAGARVRPSPPPLARPSRCAFPSTPPVGAVPSARAFGNILRYCMTKTLVVPIPTRSLGEKGGCGSSRGLSSGALDQKADHQGAAKKRGVDVDAALR